MNFIEADPEGVKKQFNMKRSNGDKEDVTKVTDVEASVSFGAEFQQEYGDNHATFNTCSLEEAIIKACFAPVQSRKLIALYFHNKDDPFSKMFCPTLVSGEVRNILENAYFVIGWNVGNEIYHGALLKSLDVNIDFEPAQEMIVKKKAALFVVYPIEDSITIFAMLHGEKVKINSILMVLQEIDKNFQMEIKNEMELENVNRKQIKTQNDIGSREFQQLMYHQLGDREYDCFEYNEHEYLKQKIGFANYGPPQTENGYDKQQNKKIEEIYKQIRLYNNKYAEWQDQIVLSFIYNCLEPMPEEKIARLQKYEDYNPHTDVLPIPVYVIRKCRDSENPCRTYIDIDGRVYNSWKDCIKYNKLHKCTMVVPEEGRYIGDEVDQVLLKKHLSPACGIGHTVLRGADITATITGLASGGILVATLIPTIAVAPAALVAAIVTGIGAGVYMMVRNTIHIYDRRVHGESISFANSDARRAYLNIVEGTLSFVGVGATTALAQFAARGVNIGQGSLTAVHTMNVLNISATGAKAANSTCKVVNDWFHKHESSSQLPVVQLSSSILFFGNAVYNCDGAKAIIKDSQMDTLHKYQEWLRINKRLKMFSKILKDTILLSNKEISATNTEVISPIRNIRSKDEAFAVLIRNKKLFSEDGVRFYAENDEIKLNGVSVDLFQFGSVTKTKRKTLLTDLAAKPQVHKTNATQTMSNINSVFEVNNRSPEVKYGIYDGCLFARLAETLLKDFSVGVQENVLRICKALTDHLLGSVDFVKISNDYFSYISREPCAVVFRFVVDFLELKMNDLETRYGQEKELAKECPGYDEQEFNAERKVCAEAEMRGFIWFEQLVGDFVNGASVDQVFLCELIRYVMNVITEKVFEHCDAEEKRKEREQNTIKNLHVVICEVCGGYYRSQKRSN